VPDIGLDLRLSKGLAATRPDRRLDCHSNSPSGSRHFEVRCQRNGANGLAVASRLAPSSEQANFSSADIVSLIGKCLTPETGEVFLTEHKKLLVCFSSMQRNVQDFPPVVCCKFVR